MRKHRYFSQHSDGAEAALFQLATGRCRLRNLFRDDAPVHKHAAAISPSGHQLALCLSKTMHLWDARTCTRLGIFAAKDGESRVAVGYLSDAHFFVAHAHGRIALWNTSTRKIVKSYQTEGTGTALVHTGPHSQRAVIAFENGILALLDHKELRQLRAAPGTASGGVWLSLDGEGILAANAHSLVRFELPHGTRHEAPTGHHDAITDIAFLPGIHQAITASRDRTLRCWNLATQESVMTYEGHEGPVTSVLVSPEGTTFCATAEREEDKTELLRWDVASGSPLESAVLLATRHALLAGSPDGHWIATGTKKYTQSFVFDGYVLDVSCWPPVVSALASNKKHIPLFSSAVFVDESTLLWPRRKLSSNNTRGPTRVRVMVHAPSSSSQEPPKQRGQLLRIDPMDAVLSSDGRHLAFIASNRRENYQLQMLAYDPLTDQWIAHDVLRAVSLHAAILAVGVSTLVYCDHLRHELWIVRFTGERFEQQIPWNLSYGTPTAAAFAPDERTLLIGASSGFVLQCNISDTT